MFTDTKLLDIISFDAFEFLDRFLLYADNLKGFMEKGELSAGVLCLRRKTYQLKALTP